MKLSRNVIIVAAILIAEVVVLSIVAFAARGAPADGIVVAANAAIIQATDQKAVTSKITIDRVVAPGPSWVVVQAEMGDGELGGVLGSEHVDAGESTDVAVSLEATALPSAAVATLIADLGVPSMLEYSPTASSGGMGGTSSAPADDRIYVAGGQVVSARFAIQPLSAKVGAGQAKIGSVERGLGDASIAASGVVAPGPSWLSASIPATGSTPGHVLGVQRVPAGLSPNVEVKFIAPVPNQTIQVMLHADLGTLGTFEYSFADSAHSVDQPYVAGGKVVSVELTPTP